MDIVWYAGIGSRETPENILNRMRVIAKHLATTFPNLILRTGGAHGADTAFEAGCLKGNGKVELYLPWNGYNDRYNNVVLYEPTYDAIQMAKSFHPAGSRLTQGALKLHGRNSHIVLGKDLDKPVSFVICYTKPKTGGTSQALRIAESLNIPIINFWYDSAESQYNEILQRLKFL